MGNIVSMSAEQQDVIPMSIFMPASFGIESTHTVVNIVILVMSLFFVKPTLCRTYAINLSIPSVIYTSFVSVMDFSHLTGVGRDIYFVGPHPLYNKTNWVNFSQAFLLRYTANSYRVFATLMVLLTYISYSYPFLYAKLINKSNTKYIFLGGHCIVAISVGFTLPGSIKDNFVNRSLTSSIKNFQSYFLYCEKLFGFVVFALMIVLYCLSIHKIIQFSKKQKTTSSINRRSQLLSVLVYCTPPNIFLLLAIPRNFCIVTQSMELITDPTFKNVCTVARVFHNPLTTIRLFVASICTLIAFNDYRRIIVAMFKRCKFAPVGTTVVPLSNINSSSSKSRSYARY